MLTCTCMCFVVSICICLSVYVYAEGCIPVTIKTDTECENLNCSQGKRLENGDEVFKCKIRRKEGWKHFLNTFGPFDAVNETDLKPPRITAIEWYLRSYGKGQYDPTLKFTFTYPRRMKNIDSASLKTGKEYIVRAVKMTWRGVDDPYYSDTFYTLAEPRIRLFDFKEYMGTTYDIYHPREITFPCITGLDTCNSNKKYYTLELASISFEPRPLIANVTYDVTTFNQQSEDWQPAIATAVYHGSCNIHVVFEPAPKRDKITIYQLVLTNMRSGENMTKETNSDFTVQFSDLERSLYELQIIAHGKICNSSVCVFKAKPINITSNVCKDPHFTSVPTSNGNVDSMKIIYAVIGVIVSLALLTLLAYIYKNKGSRHKRPDFEQMKLLILYANRSPHDESLIQCLSNLVEENCPFYDVIWDKKPNGNIYQNVNDWYQHQINSASKIMLVCPAVWGDSRKPLSKNTPIQSKHTPIQPYFDEALRFASNYASNNEKDNKWMFFLCFKFADRKNIPAFLQNVKKYRLPQETKKFCSCLNNKTGRKYSRGHNLKKSEAWKKLSDAIDVVHFYHQNNNRNRPSIEEENDEVIEDTHQTYHRESVAQSDPSCPVHGKKTFCPVHGVKSPSQNYVHTQINAVNHRHRKQNQNQFEAISEECYGTGNTNDIEGHSLMYDIMSDEVDNDTYPESNINSIKVMNSFGCPPIQYNNLSTQERHRNCHGYNYECDCCYRMETPHLDHQKLYGDQCSESNTCVSLSDNNADISVEQSYYDNREESEPFIRSEDNTQNTDDIFKMFEELNFDDNLI